MSAFYEKIFFINVIWNGNYLLVHTQKILGSNVLQL
jgi:hypothetical protein